MEDIAVIVPSLNPDERLVRVAKGLSEAGFRPIVIVNDGSREAYVAPFSAVAQIPGCLVLTHQHNKGKGGALKTGFAHILAHCPEINGVVTVDGDDQHQVNDVVACAQALKEHPDSLVLGVRDFDLPEVPWKSRMGNKLTCLSFRLFCHMAISDTQTGLRAIPRQYLDAFCRIEGDRFEYETNMLLEAGKTSIPIAEVGISTVYLEGNASSHFRVLRDSLMIYGAIVRFALSALVCAIVDLSLFAAINSLSGSRLWIGHRLLVATVTARVVSALLNYSVNRKAVFHSARPYPKSLGRYAALSCAQLAASYTLVFCVSALLQAPAMWDTLYKALVDTALFFVSFYLQKKWIF